MDTKKWQNLNQEKMKNKKKKLTITRLKGTDVYFVPEEDGIRLVSKEERKKCQHLKETL